MCDNKVFLQNKREGKVRFSFLSRNAVSLLYILAFIKNITEETEMFTATNHTWHCLLVSKSVSKVVLYYCSISMRRVVVDINS